MSVYKSIREQFNGAVAACELVIPKGISEVSAVDAIFRNLGWRVDNEGSLQPTREVYIFDVGAGLQRLAYAQSEDGSLLVEQGAVYEPQSVEFTEPESQIFDLIMGDDGEKASLWILCDLSPFANGDYRNQVGGKVIARKIHNAALRLRNSRKRVLFLNTMPLDGSYSDRIPSFRIPLPTEAELVETLQYTLSDLKNAFAQYGDKFSLKVSLGEAEIKQLVREGLGLTTEQFAQCVYVDAAARHSVDQQTIALVHERKVKELESSGVKVLPVPEVPLRGLRQFRQWAEDMKLAFFRSLEDRTGKKLKVKPPRGVLLTGVSGCGKSLGAKTLGQEWGLPVLRFSLADAKAASQALVGQTVAQVMNALEKADACAPCILLIDEIDKDFSSSTGYQGDGGASKEAIGTVLSWLNDHTSPVFTVMTANNPVALIQAFPEMFRDGRINGKFFVDLPNHDSRVEILQAHLGYHEQELSLECLSELAIASRRFTGAELESVVTNAVYAADRNDLDEIPVEFLHEAIAAMKGTLTADIAAHTVAQLQMWAKDNATPADAPTGEPEHNSAPPRQTTRRKAQQPLGLELG